METCRPTKVYMAQEMDGTATLMHGATWTKQGTGKGS